MKKNQSGVSMVSLVITIIVIIILAAVAFSGSQETIGRAGFSGFTTDIDSVRTAFMTESIPNLMGEQTAANNSVSEAQAYNFLAKGATTNTIAATDAEHSWLSRAQAAAIPATRIEKDSAQEAIGIELPERTVNTFGATGVEVSYYVTNKGDIFVWPPYARSDDGLFYINDTMTVKVPNDADYTYSVAGEDKNLKGVEISGDDEEAMYAPDFTFDVNGVKIIVSQANDSEGLASDVTVDELKALAAVYYVDERNAEMAEGIESKFVYDDRTPEGVKSEVKGIDQD